MQPPTPTPTRPCQGLLRHAAMTHNMHAATVHSTQPYLHLTQLLQHNPKEAPWSLLSWMLCSRS